MQDRTKNVIRDLRSGSFRIDDSFVDIYARIIGQAATLAYISLCRHANKHQQAWPALDLIGREMGIKSKHTVIIGIRALEQHGIIGVIRGKDKGGKQSVNVYVLFDKACWSIAPLRVHDVHPVPGASGAPNRVHSPGASSAPEGISTEGNTMKGEKVFVDKPDSNLHSIRQTIEETRRKLEKQGILRPKS